MNKKRILLIALGLIIILSIIFTGCTSTPTTPVSSPTLASTPPADTFQENFAFRGKQVSREEASTILGSRLPLPTFLPEGYAVQEIYAGTGDTIVVFLISDGPIEKISREPPDEPKDYTINLVKCEMTLYVSFENDLSVVGGNPRPTPSEMKFVEAEEENVCWWTAEIDKKTASLQLVVGKNIADREEVIKIAQSVE